MNKCPSNPMWARDNHTQQQLSESESSDRVTGSLSNEPESDTDVTDLPNNTEDTEDAPGIGLFWQDESSDDRNTADLLENNLSCLPRASDVEIALLGLQFETGVSNGVLSAIARFHNMFSDAEVPVDAYKLNKRTHEETDAPVPKMKEHVIQVKNPLEPDGKFKKELNCIPKTQHLHYRNIVLVLMSLLALPESDSMTKGYTEQKNSKEERVFGSFSSAEYVRRTEEMKGIGPIPEECTILYVVSYLDSTICGAFGKASSKPMSMSLGNFGKTNMLKRKCKKVKSS